MIPMIPPAITIPAIGGVPLSHDVPIGGALEPAKDYSQEFPVTNIQDTAGIPGVEGFHVDLEPKPPIVVPGNGVGPTGVNGTDVPIGAAGIGSGAQEPVVEKKATVSNKAADIIGIGGTEAPPSSNHDSVDSVLH